MCTQKMLQSSWLHCCREVRDGWRVLLAVSTKCICWLTGERNGNATTQLRLNLIKPQIHHHPAKTNGQEWLWLWLPGYWWAHWHPYWNDASDHNATVDKLHAHCLHMDDFAALWLLQTAPSYCIKLQREDTGHSKIALHSSGFESPTKSCAPPDPGHVRGQEI